MVSSQTVKVNLEYSNGTARAEGKLSKFFLNFAKNPRLTPEFNPNPITLIKAGNRPIALSNFIENRVPVSDVRLVVVKDGVKKIGSRLKGRARYLNAIYKTEKMKFNFAISHKNVSIVSKTPKIPQNAQNLKFSVFYNQQKVGTIAVDYPKGTNPNLLGEILCVEIFELN